MSSTEINGQPAEYLQKPGSSKYFSNEFIDNAPTDNVDELERWIEDNLKVDIQGEVKSREDFWPKDFRERNPFMADAIDGRTKTEVDWATAVLWGYTKQVYSIQTYDIDKRRESVKRYNREVVTLRDLEQRKIGMETIIDQMGLSREKAIIDHLFQQASALKAPESKNNPPQLPKPS